MLLLWFLLLSLNVFVWLVVYSNYQELSDITRLEDMAKLKMSTLSSLNASRTFSHHSLDSANPYGRFGGGGSLQPSPQIYSHHNHPHSAAGTGTGPMAIHQSHQNLHTTPQIHSKSHHSSQNSLHQSYLQMYTDTLNQRSRQSSAASLSMNNNSSIPTNSFAMTSYNQRPGSSYQPQQQQQQQQQSSYGFSRLTK